MRVRDRIGRQIKLHDLHVLMAVVEAGSMNKAAVLLNTGQSAISRSIADLEQAVGVRLVNRSARGVEPTQYGRALLEGGTAAFDDLRRAVRTIEFLADPTAGDVRIGSSNLLAASFVSAIVDRLSRRHPGIVFHLVTGHVEALHRELSGRNVDLLITRRFGPLVDDQFEFEFLFDDSFVVAAGAQSPWVRRRKIELADLVDESWVLPPQGSVIPSVVVQAFRAKGLRYPRTTVVTESSEVRTSLLATGRYLAIYPASALRFSGSSPDIRILPVELPMAPLPNGILTLKNRALGPVAELFIECAREFAKPPAQHRARRA